MPITREDLKKARENSLNSSAVLYSRPREVRIDYAPAKKERDTRRDSRTSHISHASSMLQGYGCRCPPALKHFIKYTWILVLLVYMFLMPYLIWTLNSKMDSRNTRLTELERIVDSLKSKKATPSRIQQQTKKTIGPKYGIGDHNHKLIPLKDLRDQINRLKSR